MVFTCCRFCAEIFNFELYFAAFLTWYDLGTTLLSFFLFFISAIQVSAIQIPTIQIPAIQIPAIQIFAIQICFI